MGPMLLLLPSNSLHSHIPRLPPTLLLTPLSYSFTFPPIPFTFIPWLPLTLLLTPLQPVSAILMGRWGTVTLSLVPAPANPL